MKRILTMIGCSLLMIGSAGAESLKVGTSCDYPPYNYRDAAGTLTGFDIDIAQEVGNRLGAELEFVCQAWDGMIPALLAGKFDLIVASMSITEERMKSIDFSVPYRASTGRFVARKGTEVEPFAADGKPDPAALAGKVVGIGRATTYDTYLTSEFPGVEVVRYDTFESSMLDLSSGRVDLVMAGPIALEGYMATEEGKDLAFVGQEVENIPYFGPGVGIGIRKDDGDLKKNVDMALEEMFEDGSFKTINQKYWPFTVMPSVWK
jgi:polar amino acid transport system substrate-binding protein